MPPYLPKAFVAIEDRRFYKHMGVDPLGIIRAVRANAQAGGVAEVFTPKDYDATAIMAQVLDEVRAARGLPRPSRSSLTRIATRPSRGSRAARCC